MNSRILFPAFVLVMALTSSCKTSKTTSSAATVKSTAGTAPVTSEGSESLFMYHWYATELNEKTMQLNDNGRAPYLTFTPGQVNTVAGFTGCNRLSGRFELATANKIQFSPLAVTKMACLTGGEVENDFLAAIQKAGKWSVKNKELSLYDADKIVAKFAAVDATVVKLEGNWEMNYISGIRIAFDGLYPERKPFIRFDLANSQINGNTSCNGFSSKYILNANNIKFSPGISTMMACPGNGEKTFTDMLQKVNRYALSDDNTLTFLIDDVAVMRFTRK